MTTYIQSGAAAPEGGRFPDLNDREFELFQTLIHREAGIHLTEIKKSLLVGRLGRRLRELGLGSFGAYYRKVKDDAEELVRMVDRVSTNKTHFFRESGHFDFLERIVLPAWGSSAVRLPRVRAWSAGCSTGEEACSLAAVLLANLPSTPAWDVEILATDISTRVVAKARKAIWPVAKSAEIPSRYLRPYFLKGYGSQEGLMKAGPELRERIWFERRNLIDEADVPSGPFDLIFCCNVLIYFDAPTKARVLEMLLGRLAADGYLFLGHAESLQALTRGARSVGPTIYQRRTGEAE